MKSWTTKEEQYIIDNYAKYNISYIAEQLNRTVLSIKAKAFMLNACKDLTWAKHDIDFVKANYKDMTCKQLGRRLKVCETKVATLIKRLKLSKHEL
jgi:hypothetical protein